MIRLEMKNYNMILTEKLERYQHYYQVELINMNILQVKKYYLLIKKEVRGQAKFIILFLKSFGKTNESN